MIDQRRLPFQRRSAPQKARNRPVVAWDLETTKIAAGTPRPLYLTAFGEDIRVSVPVDGYDDLADVFLESMLTDERAGSIFVSWNGNRFDNRIVMNALAGSEFTCIPYAAKNGMLRGMAVEREGKRWEFWDGMVMLGLKCTLAEFVANFAPDFPKMEPPAGEFDSSNPYDVAYAERDSESLYHAIRKAESILIATTGRGLQMTIGRAAILYFESQIPADKLVWRMNNEANDLTRKFAFRGGYVHSPEKYRGPLFQYDLNQAYAAAMRTTKLPAGKTRVVFQYNGNCPGIYIGTLERRIPCTIPVYVKTYPEGVPTSTDGSSSIRTVLHTVEIETLQRYGWNFQVEKGYIWKDSFDMSEMVDRLEALRESDVEGPNGPLGTMVKALGCNAYGKTAEQMDGNRYAISEEDPSTRGNTYWPAQPGQDGAELFWVSFGKGKTEKVYHRPQIGSTVTAAVRMMVYEAAMLSPETFVKADTDSVAFSAPVNLPIHPTTYGCWKMEHDGEEAIVLAKKVYAVKGRAIKSLGIGGLTWEDFEQWYETGIPPKVQQIQLQGWKKGVGADRAMYKISSRTGSQVA